MSTYKLGLQKTKNKNNVRPHNFENYNRKVRAEMEPGDLFFPQIK